MSKIYKFKIWFNQINQDVYSIKAQDRDVAIQKAIRLRKRDIADSFEPSCVVELEEFSKEEQTDYRSKNGNNKST